MRWTRCSPYPRASCGSCPGFGAIWKRSSSRANGRPNRFSCAASISPRPCARARRSTRRLPWPPGCRWINCPRIGPGRRIAPSSCAIYLSKRFFARTASSRGPRTPSSSCASGNWPSSGPPAWRCSCSSCWRGLATGTSSAPCWRSPRSGRRAPAAGIKTHHGRPRSSDRVAKMVSASRMLGPTRRSRSALAAFPWSNTINGSRRWLPNNWG